MSPALNKRVAAIVVGGVSAIVCASTALHYWYKRRPKSRSRSASVVRDRSGLEASTCRKGESNNRARQLSESEASSSDDGDEQEMAGVLLSPTSEGRRLGRRDYRRRRVEEPVGETAPTGGVAVVVDQVKSAFQPPVSQQQQQQQQPQQQQQQQQQQLSASTTGIARQNVIFNDPAIVSVSPAFVSYENDDLLEQQRRQLNGGVPLGAGDAALLEEEFSAKCLMDDSDEVGSASRVVDGRHHREPAMSPFSLLKGQTIESPSLGSDLVSESSQDSGKGASMGVVSSMSPVEEMIEIPPMYEFEVPQDIVGLLIGKKGTTIKWLTEQSGAHIVIRQHFFSDRHKICTLEGSREQINMCLRLIRRKFPPSRFPELKLTPILPPPISSSNTPLWDNMIQLNLPEGVDCEVVVSSIVNAGHFFVQQPTHPTFSSLNRLDQYMLAVYSQPAGVPSLPKPVEAGIICATPVLGGWYRAQTIEIYEDTGEVLVKFVDYGGYCRVPMSDLKQIRSDFMTLPFQATECYLSNVKPIDEKEGWSSEATKCVEQLSQGKVIETKLIGYARDGIPLVELLASTREAKLVSVNRLLAESGYAVWVDSTRS